jgi:cytochrome c-type biogenesis protein CcmE
MVIRRRKHTALRIVLAILVLLILGACVLLVWKRDTVRLMLYPEQIRLHGRDTVRERVQRGAYKNVETPEPDTVRYQTQDEAFDFTVRFDGGEVATLQGAVDVYKVGNLGLSEGVELGQELLSPYLEPVELEAVEALLMSDILTLASSTELNYTRDLGAFTITVTGSLAENNLRFTLENG